MKILLFGTCDEGFVKVLKSNHITVMQYELLGYGDKEQLNKELLMAKNLEQEQNIAAFSFDFYPNLADACHENCVKYISWVWDAPHMTLWSKSVRWDTNRIYLFDQEQFRQLEAREVENIFYLPLATDIDHFQNIIQGDKSKNREKWSADLSFVGSLYNEKKKAMFDQIAYLPPYEKGYLDSIMACQMQLWGANIVGETINADMWKVLREYIKLDLGDGFESGVYEMMVQDMLHKKISQTERMQMCSTLARLFDFALYTGSDTSYDSALKSRGYIDYWSEMPLVFHYSKMNVHITLRSITSGIPQRILDVLACEGFLLANYQPEIGAYFEDGKDLVVYESMGDLCAKAAYYLEHEDERKAIAHAGYLKVKELFTYERMVPYILETI